MSEPAAPLQPTQGGSYIVNPETGALELEGRTAEAQPALHTDPAAPAASQQEE